MLNYHHLHYFWAVAREGNLTRAAKQLHVSQSAVSLQIQRLEEQLGHALFERRGRALVLTEAGRVALEHAEVIFRAGQDLVGTLGGHGERRQVLRIGSLATLSRNFQLTFVRPLLGREDVELVLRSGTFGDLIRALEAHQLDAVLSNHAPARDAATPWVAHAISSQPVGLIGKAGAGKRRRPLQQLLAEEPLLLPNVESSIRTAFDALLARLHVQPRIAAEVDDMAMLRLLAREHVGIAVVPKIVVADELKRGELVELAELPDIEERFYAITSARRFPSPLLKSLLARPALPR